MGDGSRILSGMVTDADSSARRTIPVLLLRKRSWRAAARSRAARTDGGEVLAYAGRLARGGDSGRRRSTAAWNRDGASATVLGDME